MTCPVCQAHDTETILDKPQVPIFATLRDTAFTEERRFDAVLLRCRSCGFVSQKLTPELEAFLTDFYTTQESFFTQPPTEETPGPRVVQTIEYLKSHVHTNVDAILEIGAYDAFFLEQLRKTFNSTRTVGIEISDTDNAYEHISLIHDVYPSAQVKGQIFDLIVCMNVLEHVFTPREFMVEIGENLSEDGHVLIEIPNEEYAFSVGAPSFQHQHISYFTPATIDRFLDSVGFQIDANYTKDLDRMLLVCSKKKTSKARTFASDTSAVEYASRVEKAIDTFNAELVSGLTGLYGACTLTNNMLAFARNHPEVRLFDGDERKWNKYMTGIPTPIGGWQDIAASGVRSILVMPHSFSKEIATFLSGKALHIPVAEVWDSSTVQTTPTSTTH